MRVGIPALPILSEFHYSFERDFNLGIEREYPGTSQIFLGIIDNKGKNKCEDGR